MNSIRCKMRLESIVPRIWGGSEVTFRCEYDGSQEAISFAKATPVGVAHYQIDNPEALAILKIGAYYYVDFVEAP